MIYGSVSLGIFFTQLMKLLQFFDQIIKLIFPLSSFTKALIFVSFLPFHDSSFAFLTNIFTIVCPFVTVTIFTKWFWVRTHFFPVNHPVHLVPSFVELTYCIFKSVVVGLTWFWSKYLEIIFVNIISKYKFYILHNYVGWLLIFCSNLNPYQIDTYFFFNSCHQVMSKSEVQYLIV